MFVAIAIVPATKSPQPEAEGSHQGASTSSKSRLSGVTSGTIEEIDWI